MGPFDWSTGWNTLPPGTKPPGIGTSILGIPTQYLGDIGMGLLAASGPSRLPQFSVSAWGKAGLYTTDRRDQGILNEARRMEISQAAAQQAADRAFQEAVSKGDVAGIKSAAQKAYPELYAKSLFPQPLDPDTALRMLEIEQRIGESRAGGSTPAKATVRAVSTLADVFDTVEKEGSPFAPGGAFSSQGLLAKAGLNAPEVVKGMPDSMLTPFGDPATLKRQAAQAILIDKETATISQNLTQLAEKGTGRSATALNNLNTSLGAGNVPIEVRRKVIQSTLETVIDDVEARGETVDQSWYTLRDRLQEKTKDITKGGAEGNAAFQTQGSQNGTLVAQPPASTVITPQPGVPNRTVAPAAAGPGGPNRLAPAAAAPAPRRVPTAVIDPMTGAPAPTFPREADGKRGVPKGALFLVPNPANPSDPFVHRND